MQTWLVHMRSPIALLRDLGPWSFLMMQVLYAGMILSALIHPAFLATILWSVTSMLLAGKASAVDMFITGAGLTNILVGYGAFVAVGMMTLTLVERLRLPSIIALTPVYWLLLSVAAWLAVIELFRKPHHWNKTPHHPMRRPKAHGQFSAGRQMAAR